jgi:hypothetical protein
MAICFEILHPSTYQNLQAPHLDNDFHDRGFQPIDDLGKIPRLAPSFPRIPSDEHLNLYADIADLQEAAASTERSEAYIKFLHVDFLSATWSRMELINGSAHGQDLQAYFS